MLDRILLWIYSSPNSPWAFKTFLTQFSFPRTTFFSPPSQLSKVKFGDKFSNSLSRPPSLRNNGLIMGRWWMILIVSLGIRDNAWIAPVTHATSSLWPPSNISSIPTGAVSPCFCFVSLFPCYIVKLPIRAVCTPAVSPLFLTSSKIFLPEFNSWRILTGQPGADNSNAVMIMSLSDNCSNSSVCRQMMIITTPISSPLGKLEVEIIWREHGRFYWNRCIRRGRGRGPWVPTQVPRVSDLSLARAAQAARQAELRPGTGRKRERERGRERSKSI